MSTLRIRVCAKARSLPAIEPFLLVKNEIQSRGNETIQPSKNRKQVETRVGATKGVGDRHQEGEEALLQLDDVPVSVGRRPARGKRVRLYGIRHSRQVSEDAGF